MKIVIDFSGYYFKNKFTIKEFCLCRLVNFRVITEPVIIAKDPQFSVPSQPYTNSYKNFIDKYGIKNTRNLYPLNRLRQKLRVILAHNDLIYVRNGQQVSELMSFLNNSRYYRNKIKPLSDLGFKDNYELTQTNCPHHVNKSNNYCAGDNAKFMADWLVGKLNKIQLLKNMQLVINFSGYYDLNNEFIIKELSIYGLSNDGYVIYHKLYVTKPANDLTDSFMNEVDKNNYNDIYYDNFGIKYEDGNYDLFRIYKKISKLLMKYDIKIIYVKNDYYYNLLSKIIENIKKYDAENIKRFDVICLEDYNYIDTYDTYPNCEYHKHEDNNKNICVDSRAVTMVYWILTNEFYKSEVRNRFSGITLNDDINIYGNDDIDDELVNQFTINDSNELPSINSDDLEWL
ncbi:uncharacterized protein LOC130674840 [Microplitis mediator]|uniref:uncharacterized protein LOC130674840 n=1 Tax=Microplitis mediator TaxID=375433 RepID=UPI0025527D33|nr:uncharacterized protein LOC130674840 [Microplitis mediator]